MNKIGGDSDISDVTDLDIGSGKYKVLTSTQVPKRILPFDDDFNSRRVFNNDRILEDAILPSTNGFNLDNVSQPPLQARGTQHVFNESVFFNASPISSSPSRQWGLFDRGGGVRFKRVASTLPLIARLI